MSECDDWRKLTSWTEPATPELVAAGALADEFWWRWYREAGTGWVRVHICVSAAGDLASALAWAQALLQNHPDVRKVGVGPVFPIGEPGVVVGELRAVIDRWPGELLILDAALGAHRHRTRR